MSKANTNTYIVYGVDAADRLQLLVPPQAGESPEMKNVLLSYIQTPRLAKKDTEGEFGEEDPCAFEAMEFIRTKCIGKTVTFTDDFGVEILKRTSGRLTLPDGKDASKELLKNGLATISDRSSQNKVPKDLLDTYTQLQDQAKAAKVGIWAKDAKKHVRKMLPFPSTDKDGLIKSLKGKTEKMRVERALSGSSLIVTILSTCQQLQLQFTGIQAPSVLEKDGSTNPLGAEAKFHTERSLLHRHLPIQVDGMDKFGNFLGSLNGPKGTYQEELLSRGFVFYNDATAAYSEHRSKYRELEMKAREAKIGVHQNVGDGSVTVVGGASPQAGATVAGANEYKGPNRDYNGVREFEAILSQVQSGDTIIVRCNDGEYKKIALSGVKCTKVDRPHGQSEEQRVTYGGYSWEAREHLRTKFIGKHVSVAVDFGIYFEATKETRASATVRTLDGNVNVAASVISQGFATFDLRRNDTCTGAEELLQAEEIALSKGLGLHSGAESPKTSVNEMHRLGLAKGRNVLSFLNLNNRPTWWKGIVELVTSGSSFKVFIPKQHFQISLKLAGIITPNTGMHDEAADPFAAESKDFAIQKVQQREVEIMVETVDKGGNFIGTCTIGGKNFAAMIVEEGLATVAAGNKVSNITELQRAEKAAKDAQKYIWSSRGALPARQQKRNAQMMASNPDVFIVSDDRNPINVSITEVTDGNTIWLQPQDDDSGAKYEEISEVVATLGEAAPHPNPQRNEIVAAYYRADKSWLRGKVVSAWGGKSEKSIEVLFIDYGTRSSVATKDLRQIPAGEDAFKIVKNCEPLAFEVKLAYLKPMSEDDDNCESAVAVSWEFAEKEGLQARKEYTDGNKRQYYSVADTAGKTLSVSLLEAGVALVEKRAGSVDAEGTRIALAAQEVAKKNHRMMWKYGDVDDDDEE